MAAMNATHPVWADAVPPLVFPPLGADATADVCVIGAGIAGLTTAYLLSQAGRRVLVIDDGAAGGGETGRTSAHLSCALDDRYYLLERLHGRRGAHYAAASHAAAIDLIESIVAAHAIDCGFERVDGYLFVPPGESTEILDRELVAAQRAGLEVTRQGRSAFPDFDTGPCLRFANQAQFHPLRYLAGLVQALQDTGATVCGETHATRIDDGEPCRVHTAGGAVIAAADVVVATNVPVNDRLRLHTKQAAYRSYVITLPVPQGAVPTALYWDTPDPYHYVRVLPNHGDLDLLLVGGEDHKTGQENHTEECFARLEAWARQRFPVRGEVRHRWSGQIIEPVDGLAFIGRNPGDRHVYITTGDSGNGLTHGTLAGLLLRDLILGRDNPWATLYDPGRKTLGALREFARENLNVAQHYGDWLTPGEVRSLDELAPGQGALLRRGIHKLAVYRGEDGVVQACAAECPHLGCIVTWNPTEHSWDCPCHGSRFDPQGRVLNGPAIVDLKFATLGESD